MLNNYLINKINLPNDLCKLCLFYMDTNEFKYFNNKWNDFPKDKCCFIAAQYGWLDLLIWCHENEYYWNSRVYFVAIQNGHLEIVKYAYQHGCEWHKFASLFSVQYGQLEILKWIYDNNIECDEETYSYANNNIYYISMVNRGENKSDIIIIEPLYYKYSLEMRESSNEKILEWMKEVNFS